MTSPRFLGAWGRGPERPRLSDGEIQVWRIPLAPEGGPAGVLGDPLTPEECRRAAQFLRPGDGVRWAASRVALRSILAGYLGVAAADVAFERGVGGKPRVRGAGRLQYNLTHSYDLAICAIGSEALGVDVEKIRSAPMAAGVAAGIVSASGPIRPDEGASAELDWVFFTAWTRVEASLKATGEGLSGIDRRSPEHIRSLATPGQTLIDGRPLRILDLPVDDGYASALAVLGDSPITVIRCWTWSR